MELIAQVSRSTDGDSDEDPILVANARDGHSRCSAILVVRRLCWFSFAICYSRMGSARCRAAASLELGLLHDDAGQGMHWANKV
jgi:hypothetical protein